MDRRLNKTWLAGLPVDVQAQWSGHIATRQVYGEVEVVTWANPRNSHYSLQYALLPTNPSGARSLAVTGDLGDAIYQWYSATRMTLEDIAGVNASYLSEKCVASETGLGFQVWSPKAARSALLDDVRDWLAGTSMDDHFVDETMEEIRSGNACETADALTGFLVSDAGAHEVWGDCMWEVVSCGYVHHERLELHLLGLRAAMRYFAAQADERKGESGTARDVYRDVDSFCGP